MKFSTLPLNSEPPVKAQWVCHHWFGFFVAVGPYDWSTRDPLLGCCFEAYADESVIRINTIFRENYAI